MPPKRTKGKAKPRTSDEEIVLTSTDVQYNPEIIQSLLMDLNLDVEAKCQQIQNDIDFMATSIQQAFQIELIKLPMQVRNMPLSRFKQEFGDNIASIAKPVATTRPATVNAPPSAVKMNRSKINPAVLQTPSNAIRTSSLREPVEGERILSANGSPLGTFSTVVKAPRPDKQGLAPPPTPGYVTLSSGDLVSLDDVETLPEQLKEDALSKMQAMMSSMQSMMSKLQTGKAGTAAIL